MDIKLQPPQSRMRIDYWIGWHPDENYPLANEVFDVCNRKPTTPMGWEKLIYEHGPIVISGMGIGMSTGTFGIGHSILLIGASQNSYETFYYLDPLVGNQILKAPWSMNKDISDGHITYANTDIIKRIQLNYEKYFTITRYS
ncbi:MAG: hypothetical protein KAH18_04610 [Psychromonas sp.]|nr:hypothetical protein [Psychromonas sp.]